MKEIVLSVPDDLVHNIEMMTQLMPEVEIVRIQESKVYELDEMNRRMAYALRTLLNNNVIRHQYDYAWIMTAINDRVIAGMKNFSSPQSFINYLKDMGIEHVPCRSTISGYCEKVVGKYPDWIFTDTSDPHEVLRRKNVVAQLISAYNKAD